MVLLAKVLSDPLCANIIILSMPWYNFHYNFHIMIPLLSLSSQFCRILRTRVIIFINIITINITIVITPDLHARYIHLINNSRDVTAVGEIQRSFFIVLN